MCWTRDPLMRRRSYSGGEQECERGSRMDSTPRREVRGDGVGKSGPRRAAPQVNLLIKRRAKSYIISLHLVVKPRVRVVLCRTSHPSMQDFVRLN